MDERPNRFIMNNEEKLLKQNKTLLIFIIILLLILIGLISYFALSNKKEPPKEDNTKIEEKKKEDNKKDNIDNKPGNNKEDNNKQKNNDDEIVSVKTPTKEELIEYTKKKMKEMNLLEEDNIETWTFDTVQLEGYYKNEPNTKFYAVIGKFRCKEGHDCVYQEQLDDPDKDGYYKWSAAITTEFSNNSYTFIELGSTTFILGTKEDPLIEVWEDIE